jgi:serine/threonine protein kinase
LSPDFVDFIDRCLVVNPTDRADTNELLCHPFLNKAKPLSALVPYIEVRFLGIYLGYVIRNG